MLLKYTRNIAVPLRLVLLIKSMEVAFVYNFLFKTNVSTFGKLCVIAFQLTSKLFPLKIMNIQLMLNSTLRMAIGGGGGNA